MKEFFTTIKEDFILLLGIGSFIYNLFNWDSRIYCGDTGPINLLENCKNPLLYYFYHRSTLILLVIAAILITLGLIKIKRRNNK
jgi:hypothetical protein